MFAIMDTILVIDCHKLRSARGIRTRRQIVLAGDNRFSEQQLHAWEKGIYRPRPETIPVLLRALGVRLEQIASPVGAVAA